MTSDGKRRKIFIIVTIIIYSLWKNMHQWIMRIKIRFEFMLNSIHEADGSPLSGFDSTLYMWCTRSSFPPEYHWSCLNIECSVFYYPCAIDQSHRNCCFVRLWDPSSSRRTRGRPVPALRRLVVKAAHSWIFSAIVSSGFHKATPSVEWRSGESYRDCIEGNNCFWAWTGWHLNFFLPHFFFSLLYFSHILW